jgi:predicted bacteriocin transport accessory protein
VKYHQIIKGALSAFLLVTLIGCSSAKTKITNTVELNTSDADMDQYTWIGDEIGDFRKVTMKEVLRLFDEQGSGILFFGYPGCKWCERAVPVLNEAILEKGVTVYYADMKDTYDSSDMDILKQDIYDALPVDADGNRDFYVPMVVGVKKGKVTGHHTSLVDGFVIQSDTDQMNDAQKKELKNLYLDIIQRTAD